MEPEPPKSENEEIERTSAYEPDLDDEELSELFDDEDYHPDGRLRDETVQRAVATAWDHLQVFQTLTPAVRVEVCRLLGCEPAILQQWIDEHTPEELAKILF